MTHPLLTPRYMVEADYPNSPFRVGDIIYKPYPEDMLVTIKTFTRKFRFLAERVYLTTLTSSAPCTGRSKGGWGRCRGI